MKTGGIPGGRLSLMLIAAVLLVVALIGPALDLERDVYDFVFVLDITGSMNVADAGPGAGLRRLDFAKQLVHEALGEMPCGSRVGLAIFTEHRTFLLFAPVEVCANYLVVSTMLERIDRRMAWADRSEVAKGLYSGIDTVSTLDSIAANTRRTQLIFMTDGHEAPPVNFTLRPRFRGPAGEVSGLIAGIGGSVPVPIPILDENDRVIGYWGHDDVLQVDRYSLGRPGTERGEPMVGIDPSAVKRQIARGTEHLSSLREAWLEQLAAETGLDYLHVTSPAAFARRLLDSRVATQEVTRSNVAWIPALLSLLCVLGLCGRQLLRNGVSFAIGRRRHDALRPGAV
ncbi:hypothetical protein BH24PSE2_BH24PSE2_00190 [soil metagenome]